jgi:tRNA/rRNA methyltransferase
MIQHMASTLLAAGYLDPLNPEHILRTYRRIFSRAGLDDRDVRILHGLWSLIDRQLLRIKDQDLEK